VPTSHSNIPQRRWRADLLLVVRTDASGDSDPIIDFLLVERYANSFC